MKGSYMYTIYKCTFCGFATDFEPTNCHICGSDDFKQEQRKQTQADRIRAMSDEELAGLIWLELPVHVLQQDKSLGHIKDWLQQEVE